MLIRTLQQERDFSQFHCLMELTKVTHSVVYTNDSYEEESIEAVKMVLLSDPSKQNQTSLEHTV